MCHFDLGVGDHGVAAHTYGMKDMEETFAGRQAVCWINPFYSSYSEKHPNRRPKGKEDLWLIHQLRVIGRNLEEFKCNRLIGREKAIFVHNTTKAPPSGSGQKDPSNSAS